MLRILFFIKSIWRHKKFLLRSLSRHTQRKYIYRWLRSLKPGYLIDTPSPWFTFDAIEFLKSYIRKDMNVFEYGSGGSTLFWLRSGAACVSVEHNPEWSNLMQRYVGGVSQVDYRLVLPNPMGAGEALDISDPKLYISGGLIGYDFKEYVCQIDSFPDNYFDVVSIDGRARPACLMHSAKKVKLGGLLILDDADRRYYIPKTLEYLENYRKMEFSGIGPAHADVWKTNIYIRIK